MCLSANISHPALLIHRKQGTIIEVIYFWFSFCLLVSRIMVMTLFAADINEESRKPAEVLRAIPSSGFCIEVSEGKL